MDEQHEYLDHIERYYQVVHIRATRHQAWWGSSTGFEGNIAPAPWFESGLSSDQI
jgi:hypothetical protein